MKKKRVSCTEYGATVATSYLKAHMDRIHGICVPQTRGGLQGRGRADHICGVLTQVVTGGEVSGAVVSGSSS